MAGYNQEFPSRLIADGFTFFCQQHQSAGMSLTFRVSAYRWRNTVFFITSCHASEDTKIEGMDAAKEKNVKSAKRIIEPLIKLSIYKRRACSLFESMIYLK